MRVGLWIGVVRPKNSTCRPPVYLCNLCTIIECAMYTVPAGPETFLVHGHPIVGYLMNIAKSFQEEFEDTAEDTALIGAHPLDKMH